MCVRNHYSMAKEEVKCYMDNLFIHWSVGTLGVVLLIG